MITITDKAVKRAKILAKRDNKPPVLRVGVRGGGCSGMNYFLDFVDEEAVKENDEVLEIDGLKVLCDAKSLQFIEGTSLDFDTNLLNGGFRFNNPNAKRTCGCGESFTV